MSTTDQWIKDISAKVDEILYDEHESITGNLLEDYFGIPQSKIRYPDEQVNVRSGIGEFQSVSDEDQFHEMKSEHLGSKTAEPEIKSGKIEITRRGMSYDGIFEEKLEEARKFRTSYIDTENAKLTDLFVNGDTQLYTAYDGLPIFTGTGTRTLVYSGISQAPNYLEKNTLDGAALEELEQNFMKMTRDTGQPISRNLSNMTIMCGPDYLHTLIRLLESPYQPGNSQNDINVYYGRYKILLNNRLVGTHKDKIILIDNNFMTNFPSIQRRYEWPFEVTPFHKIADQKWQKEVSYSREYMPIMYQGMAMLKIV